MTSAALAVQELARTFAKLQKGNLPFGCASVTLLDEDDMTVWFVNLEYPAAAHQLASTVSIKLVFPSVGNGQEAHRMPMIFVVQPRLRAPFIHHGAVCSLDLMSQSIWSPTLDAVHVLLMTVHSTLDLAHGLVTVNESDRGQHYSAREHESGMEHIHHIHATQFRRRGGGLRVVTGDESSSNVEQEITPASGKDNGIVASNIANPPLEIDTGSTLVVKSVDDLRNALCTTGPPSPTRVNCVLHTNISEHNHPAPLIIRSGMSVTLSKPPTPLDTSGGDASMVPPATVKAVIPNIIIEAGASLTVMCGISLESVDGIVCSGTLTVDRAEIHSSITVDSNGTLTCHYALLSSSASSIAGVQDGTRNASYGVLLTMLDHAKVHLVGTHARQVQCIDVACTRTVTSTRPLGILFVSNNATLRMTEGSSVMPMKPPGAINDIDDDDEDIVWKRPRCAIYAEQNASVVLSDTLIVTGHSEGVLLQGCTGSIVRCILASWKVVFPSPSSSFSGASMVPQQLQQLPSRRTGGVCAELNASVVVTDSLACGLYFGFAVIGGSIGQFDGCQVLESINGYTVDASVASLNLCFAACRHVGVFVLNRGKCTITSSFATHSTHSPITPTILEMVTANKASQAEFLSKASILHVNPDADEEAVEGSVPRTHIDTCPYDASIMSLTAFIANWDGERLRRPTSAFVGGLFSIEARGGALHATDVVCIDADDTAVYAYDHARLTLNNAVLLINNETTMARLRQQEPGRTRDRAGIKASDVERAVITGVVVHGFEFAFAVLNSTAPAETDGLTAAPAVAFKACVASLCFNGFTVDASSASLTNCGCDARVVGLYALNQSSVSITANDDSGKSTASFPSPRDLLSLLAQRSFVPLQNVFNGGNYGIEVNSSTVSCGAAHNNVNRDDDIGHVNSACVTISNAREAGLSCYGVNASLDAFGVRVVNLVADKTKEVAGFRATSRGSIRAERCTVEHVMFGFLVMDGAQLTVLRCSTDNVINGLTVDGGQALVAHSRLVGCAQVALYNLSAGATTVTASQLQGNTYGVEMKNGGTLKIESSRIFGFQHTGLRLYVDDNCDAAKVNTVDADSLDVDASSSASVADSNDEASNGHNVNCCIVAQRSSVTLRQCTLRNALHGCALDLTRGATVAAWDLVVRDCFKGICLASGAECVLLGSATTLRVHNQVILADRESIVRIDGATRDPHDIAHHRAQPLPSSPPRIHVEGTQLAVVATRPVLVLGSGAAASAANAHRSQKSARGAMQVSNVSMVALEHGGDDALISAVLDEPTAYDMRLETILITAKPAPPATRQLLTIVGKAPSDDIRGGGDNGEHCGVLLRDVRGVVSIHDSHSSSIGDSHSHSAAPRPVLGLRINVLRYGQSVRLEGVTGIASMTVSDNAARVICDAKCTFTSSATATVIPNVVSLANHSKLWIARNQSAGPFEVDNVTVTNHSKIVVVVSNEHASAVAKNAPDSAESSASHLSSVFALNKSPTIDSTSAVTTITAERWAHMMDHRDGKVSAGAVAAEHRASEVAAPEGGAHPLWKFLQTWGTSTAAGIVVIAAAVAAFALRK